MRKKQSEEKQPIYLILASKIDIQRILFVIIIGFVIIGLMIKFH
jgi:hypothetical protein